MNIDLPLLKSFTAIADHGNFLTASKAVNRSPAAVSMHIKKLEEELGYSLFERDARQTKLTKNGERLLPYARRMLRLEKEIETEFDNAPLQGSIQLGVPDDVVERFPMRILSAFMNEYPNVTLGIHVDHTPALLSKVDKNVLDLSIITYAPSIYGVSECERLTREPEIWVMAANGISARKTPLPITLWDQGWAWHEPVISILKEADIEYSIILECENLTARKSAIEADLAIGPLPHSLLDSNLAEVPHLKHLPALPEYGLGLKTPKNMSPETEAVAEYLRNHFRQSELMSSWKSTRRF
ncbi:MAG: LysR family transcriptional regulator [Rhizobiaceae bacterium]|nr:LysR family transcriptional regulator [Rhizobiaceae bacterium]